MWRGRAAGRSIIQPDFDTPSVARMYDYLIGGRDNYSADREACAELLRIAPSTRELALVNRAFLVRSVRYLAEECGVTQYIDHGSGLPTPPNVHQIVQEIHPDAARVVYVDNDPIVLGHGKMMLEEDTATTAVILQDMRKTDAIFESEEVRRLIDRNKPIACLFVSVLHCVPEKDDPWKLVRDVARRLPSGSYLVISQLASDDPQLRSDITQFMRATTGGNWGEVRSLAEVNRFFDGLEMVETQAPCEVSLWRPDGELGPRQKTKEWVEFGGVARVP
ncbi:SAM-dependent methyltransferase [Streptomyces sp. NPDC059604]|uniref:SAM-dependent methyltransferase n=1 Tax=Streptomyces sp. NPDC059604 TaxID=3346881 RepID=UPI00367F6704